MTTISTIWQYFTPEERAAACAHEYAYNSDRDCVHDNEGYCPLARALELALGKSSLDVWTRRALPLTPKGWEVGWYLQQIGRLHDGTEYTTAALNAALFIEDWDAQRIPVLADAMGETQEGHDATEQDTDHG